MCVWHGCGLQAYVAVHRGDMSCRFRMQHILLSCLSTVAGLPLSRELQSRQQTSPQVGAVVQL